jgi:hypothetical protein
VEANTVIMRSTAKPLAGTGFAGLAQVIYCYMAQRQQLSTEETNHVVVPRTDQRDYTNISSWLIDSGCSQHMTPVREDLIQWEECVDGQWCHITMTSLTFNILQKNGSSCLL